VSGCRHSRSRYSKPGSSTRGIGSGDAGATAPIAAIAATALIATGTAASASVNVTDGTGFVGKGDVQTALGYANNNAFTDTDARSATFTIDNATDVSIDAKCAVKLPTGGFDYDTVHDIVVPLGYVGLDETVITSEERSPAARSPATT
jgi:hypothetical protein